MTSLDRQLMALGLTNMQSRMYVTLLHIGEATASQLAKDTGINRVTAYTALTELEELSLVRHDDYEQIRLYQATEIENLEQLFMGRAKAAIQSYREAQSLLPDLKAVAHTHLRVPQTTYVEGQHAIKHYLSDIPATSELRALYLSDESHYELIKSFAKRAADAETRPQVIIPNSIKANLIVYLDHRVVPGRIAQFPATTMFFPDRTVMILQEGDVMQLFAIVDERIATQYLSAFTLNWRILSGHHLILPERG